MSDLDGDHGCGLYGHALCFMLSDQVFLCMFLSLSDGAYGRWSTWFVQCVCYEIYDKTVLVYRWMPGVGFLCCVKENTMLCFTLRHTVHIFIQLKVGMGDKSITMILAIKNSLMNFL